MPSSTSALWTLRPVYRYGETDSFEGTSEFNLRLHKVVLQSDFQWQEKNWDRRDLRMVYDFPKHSVRSAIGDVRPASNDVLVPLSLGGISFATDFTMIPQGRPLPSPSTELMLERQARVNVFSEGQLLQSLTLLPGRYRVSDFPFATGINDLRFDVFEDGGRSCPIPQRPTLILATKDE